ncbi:FAD/NAD(P)-binding protein [Pseudomonas tolaasii]|uniref:FAD/NAD(P)-binding protein n=3 Tax=Pseudomonas TaxID=286 RepID=A0A7Y8DQW0_PSETO|nr:FAD/NAD(P)-binding protein [Pseudomonas tolaasii]ARB27935.1 hydroxyacylglutathione hydrolase [Pseudomonas tolaasii]KAB0477798.1 hydroxyacylglutathione hydrolase [Pseudomonas tolaasii]MBW4795752.1 FAD/NAD(P)-binding protein [Pseudomonas tolaasii]MBY8942644.1 FAD/NAD(P)-binding protein [Pseudomonas tolaasii]NWC20639.1 FAD/NAD(P)-binding protein [Pseudomonas tolaasii]
MSTKTIAIVGAGFCGSTLAIHLLRHPPANPLKILLFSKPGSTARGVAYGTLAPAHVLNVPAGRMDALAGEDGSFHNYVKRSLPTAGPGSFVERRLYGDYLEALLREAICNAPPQCDFQEVAGEVIKIIPQPDAGGGILLMENGEHFRADSIVLSVGNCARRPPSIAPEFRPFYDSPRYVNDPWQPGALNGIGNDDPVFLIGSGLTMLDVVLDLRDRGHRGTIHAVSRRGLLPQPHRELSAHPSYDSGLSEHMLTHCSARHYLRSVRSAVRQHALADGDWRDIIGGLRSATQQLWHALPLVERRRFLRHIRPYWDAHRHRCAPQPGARLHAELASGTLKLSAARIIGYRSNPHSVSVSLRRRGACAEEQLQATAVINCTTPALDFQQLDTPLLNSLREEGLLTPDALGTGLNIAPSGALLDGNATPSGWLFYVGPFLQARDWEATAVPELREYVKRMADTLCASLARP